MGISVIEAKNHGLLSSAVLNCVPDQCEVCGSTIEFTESLKQVYCPNRFCALKVASRLEAMAKAMKADGWGESTCIEVCKAFRLQSPYQVFDLTGHSCNAVAAFDKKMKSITDPEKRKVKLWEVVRLAGIPSIETIAYKIFDGYESIEEAYQDIEKLQVPFIAEKLGLKNADTGVMAVSVFNTLMEYKTELLYGQKHFEVYVPTGQTLYIAVTGGVSGFRNKSEYIDYINKRYGGKINAMLMNSVTHSINALIADGDTSSNKYKTACRILEKQKAENEKRIASGQKPLQEIIITDGRGLIKMLDGYFSIS